MENERLENRSEVISCIGCKYYFVTWDKNSPKGCRYFGFKSIKMPCQVVKESSGIACSFYSKK